MRNILVFTFTLVVLSVHGYAPGSAQFCLVNKTYTNGSCDHRIATTTEIKTPDCCSDECMIGSNVNLPSTELSSNREILAKKFQTERVLQIATALVEIHETNFLQFQFADTPGSSPPTSQMTRLAKLHILII